MALRNSLFAVSGKASFLDARRDMCGLFVCSKTTLLPIAGVLDRSKDNLVTGRSDTMSVTVHPFNAVLNRSGALLIQNDGDVVVPLSAAPSANSRIDVVFVKQYESRSPMSDTADIPEFNVAKGTPAAVPVAPAVPAGALALAQVLIPAGVSNTAAAGVVITQTYLGAALKGGKLRVQNAAQRDTLNMVYEGTVVTDASTGRDYVRKGGKWCGWNMLRSDISVGKNGVAMWASAGVGHILFMSDSVDLKDWNSRVAIGKIADTAFYPRLKESLYVPTRDSYYPTLAEVTTTGSVQLGYVGGPTGKRTAAGLISYSIG